MKIGIVVHSQTGHTLGIAQAIEKALKEETLTADIKMVVAKSKKPWKESQPGLSEIPDPKPYDVLILGAPVWGFRLSLVMTEYLYSVRPLNPETLIIFSTGARHKWFGGIRAMKKMAALSGVPDSKIVKAGSIRFPRNKKPKYINETIQNVVKSVQETLFVAK